MARLVRSLCCLAAVVVSASACKTETQLATCGAVAVGGVGGYYTWEVAQLTAYNATLRDDEGRLVPIAQQTDKNLMPVAIGIGTLTTLVAGGLLTIVLITTVTDAAAETEAEAAKSRPAIDEAPKRAPRSPTPIDEPILDERGSEPVGDAPPPQ